MSEQFSLPKTPLESSNDISPRLEHVPEIKIDHTTDAVKDIADIDAFLEKQKELDQDKKEKLPN